MKLGCSRLLSLAREREPTIERSCTLFAAPARLNANGIRHSLYDVAQTHILVRNEAWETHGMS
jgi:hypothetical protein